MNPQGFGFPKSARLLKSADFSRVMRGGKRVVSRHFVVFFSAREESTSRLGITVSRKIGNAIRRNRVKRWVREVFRHESPEFLDAGDFVVLARKHADFSGATHQLVKDELVGAWARLGLLGSGPSG